MRRFLTVACFSCGLVVSAWLNVPTVQGAVLLADTFSYADGALTTNSSFAWNTHSGTAGQTQVAAGKVQLTSSQSEDVNRLLTGQPYAAAGSTNVFYASFTVRFTTLPSAGGEYFTHFNAGTFRARIWALTGGATAGALRLGISSTNGSAISATNLTDLNLNTDYRVVTRLVNTNCIATLWINPTAETDPGVSTSETPTTVTVSAYAFRQTTGIGTLTVDDLLVGTTFADVVTNAPAVITTQPQSQTATAGDIVTFTVAAEGTPPLSYQWQSNNISIANATNTTFTLVSVTTNLTGSTYFVTITNAAGATNSQTATLTVTSAPPVIVASNLVSYLHYNVKGNGATNWSTSAPQVQAIGRELVYLNPDIIAFNEIPYPYTYEMTNFVNAFLPGYYLATNSGTDVGAIRSVIVSRYPIIRSTSWLDGAQLEPWGYSNANFTRDLFEAEIAVPGFAQHLHVFTTHLKSSISGYTDAAAKRAAEAAAITNFFATNFFVLYPLRPYILSGDLNEADTNTLAIQQLISAPAGLRLTNPTNPVTGSINTYATTTANPGQRIDYILPCGLLASNIASSQVFRTDKLSPVPPNLFSNDCKVASDHLPVLMVFNNPYLQPIRVTTLQYTEAGLTAQWNAVPGGTYRVETSTNLIAWNTLATNLTATNGSYTYTTNLTGNPRFFRIRAP